MNFFAPAPRGIESFLAAELKDLGGAQIRATRAGVYFTGKLETAYRACLWSRLASRVLMPLKSFPAADADQLYDGTRLIPWEGHFSPSGSFAVDAVGSTPALHHSKFAALKVKDAIVDRFRERFGKRPSVQVVRPSIRVHLRLHRNRATVSLDLSGESLHRRGYRSEGGAAPLKENLAAGILRCVGWTEMSERGGSLVDPMCGSGTLVIEGALMAGDVAPGLSRTYFGFLGWKGHDSILWTGLLDEAGDRRQKGLTRIPYMIGFDRDARMVAIARENARNADIGEKVHFAPTGLDDLRRPLENGVDGLVVTNPPYGERLGDQAGLLDLYRGLGCRLRDDFSGWQGAVFVGNPSLESALGMVPDLTHDLFNGSIPCHLLEFRPIRSSAKDDIRSVPGGEMFVNRLRKNLKRIGRWADREKISCFRLYDADVPEFAAAVDLYGQWVHVQEYAPPAQIDPVEAGRRLNFILSVLPGLLDRPPAKIFLKVRQRQKGGAQYQQQDRQGTFFEVQENDLKYLVNFTDYLDTGLFLDHRPTRRLLRELAPGKRFLNLYAYTGSATVSAAAGGASESVSVDISKTYLDWAARNLAANDISLENHRLIRADCRQWLEQAISRNEKFDLIFLDPPTFSRSKRMEGNLDIQRDHVDLITKAGCLLKIEGLLIFSNNFRKFRLDLESLTNAGFLVEDLTENTLDPDFRRRPPIHRCWIFRIKPGRSRKAV